MNTDEKENGVFIHLCKSVFTCGSLRFPFGFLNASVKDLLPATFSFAIASLRLCSDQLR